MDFNHALPFLFPALVAAIIVGIVIYSRIQARKRTEALASIAPQLGFKFSGEEIDDHPSTFSVATSLFSRGHSKQSKNILTGSLQEVSTCIFDYRYITGGGKSSHTWNQTVVAFSKPLWLPEFELRPEGFVDRVADHFTHSDIDFDAFPDFSHRFLLRGAGEAEIRNLFSSSLISLLQELPQDQKWHIEGNSDLIVIYQAESLVNVDLESYRSFLLSTSSIASAFFASAKRVNQPVR